MRVRCHTDFLAPHTERAKHRRSSLGQGFLTISCTPAPMGTWLLVAAGSLDTRAKNEATSLACERSVVDEKPQTAEAKRSQQIRPVTDISVPLGVEKDQVPGTALRSR